MSECMFQFAVARQTALLAYYLNYDSEQIVNINDKIEINKCIWPAGKAQKPQVYVAVMPLCND